MEQELAETLNWIEQRETHWRLQGYFEIAEDYQRAASAIRFQQKQRAVADETSPEIRLRAFETRLRELEEKADRLQGEVDALRSRVRPA
ncbi:hypothetical protein SAMN05216548_101300 [Faunimonas pinastri]|uniref:Uncharacterized protein n=1 Tax=Faunimonas pinastri TaxID=1855383 RepID=A0A1H9A1C0_9HYPH|nr:hypothetical protein [Faunimonas pinastri]SEP70470.1 hypothetical protein SAMN05216548_101300 [Faunimonas pinastri]